MLNMPLPCSPNSHRTPTPRANSRQPISRFFDTAQRRTTFSVSKRQVMPRTAGPATGAETWGFGKPHVGNRDAMAEDGSGYFITQSDDGGYSFVLKARNG